MNQKKNQVVPEILIDERHGKRIPWKVKKIRALKVADSFQRLGQKKRATRMRDCGSFLTFDVDPETGEKHLHDANFCRERFCPMCQWRRSLKVFHQVSQVMSLAEKREPSLVPLFLTLTLRNCRAEDLSGTLDTIFSGWNRLLVHRKVKRVVQGWFRALEVTYNKADDTFHPHIHAIILVERDYFRKTNADYMQTEEWVQRWRQALRLDYDPVCDIRRIRNGKKKYKAIAEVAKYALKDSDFISDDIEAMDRLVSVLSEALRGRRLLAFGGLLKQLAKELGQEELAEGSLVHIDENSIRGEGETVLEVYRWSFKRSDYIKECSVCSTVENRRLINPSPGGTVRQNKRGSP